MAPNRDGWSRAAIVEALLARGYEAALPPHSDCDAFAPGPSAAPLDPARPTLLAIIPPVYAGLRLGTSWAKSEPWPKDSLAQPELTLEDLI